MSSREQHKVTWFERDDSGRWQWMGFEDQLDTEPKIGDWLDAKQQEALEHEEQTGTVKESFVLDLETAAEMLAELSEIAQQHELLKEWLNDVVCIEKITVEEEFDEFCKRKLGETDEDEDDEEDDPGVATAEEHVREGK